MHVTHRTIGDLTKVFGTLGDEYLANYLAIASKYEHGYGQHKT
jgi:hypothetical protein